MSRIFERVVGVVAVSGRGTFPGTASLLPIHILLVCTGSSSSEHQAGALARASLAEGWVELRKRSQA